MRYGIIGGGNLIFDNIKVINYYPNKNMMCNIVQDPINAIGGCPHNVLVDLSKMNVNIPLYALGLIGEDYQGDLVLKDFHDNNINTDYVQKINYRNTSFTDCMIEQTSGNRTFFHYPGANQELDFPHFVTAAEKCEAKIFHIANLLHLEKLDSEDEDYGLISARVLKYLQEKGFRTSVDLVSVKSDLFEKIVKHCLKFIDYLIINEIEAESLSGMKIRHDEEIDKENLYKTGEFLIKNGVNKLVVIHFPEGGYAVNTDLNHFFVDCFKVESSEIKSAVGAGDAFAAGMLYCLHEELSIEEGLRVANASARFNLFDRTATGGATTLDNINSFINTKLK